MAALAVALASCASPEEGFDLRGARVVVDTDAPFAHAGDFVERLESTLDVALRYWGGSWDHLSGVSILLSGADGVECGGATSLGCWDGAIRITTRDPGAGAFRCVEQTVLVHEVGHAVLGDPLHRDPRWMQFEAVETALAGRLGYAESGEVECLLWPSVWRHPLGTR